MDVKKATQHYIQARVKHAAAIPWKTVGDYAIHAGGMAAGAVGGRALSQGMADTIGVDADTRRLPVNIATGLGLLSGYKLTAALRRYALARAAIARGANGAADVELNKGLKDVGTWTAFQLGSDAGLGGGIGLLKSNKQHADAETARLHREATQGPLDRFPGGIPGAIGAGALAATGTAALYELARAANRVGSGHVVRTSVSLRKRPGQLTDINVGLAPFKARSENLDPIHGRLGGPGELDYGDTDPDKDAKGRHII